MNIVGAGFLVFFLRRRVGGVDLVRVGDAIVRITTASVVLGAAAFGLWYVLDDVLGRSLGAQIASLGVALVVGGVVYLAACRLLGVRELDVLRETVRRRTPRGDEIPRRALRADLRHRRTQRLPPGIAPHTFRSPPESPKPGKTA